MMVSQARWYACVSSSGRELACFSLLSIRGPSTTRRIPKRHSLDGLCSFAGLSFAGFARRHCRAPKATKAHAVFRSRRGVFASLSGIMESAVHFSAHNHCPFIFVHRLPRRRKDPGVIVT
jgi:hypothetical protein